MRDRPNSFLSRRDTLRATLLIVGLIVALVWTIAHFLEPAPPRRIVLASGPATVSVMVNGAGSISSVINVN